jgi:hypothetical protein
MKTILIIFFSAILRIATAQTNPEVQFFVSDTAPQKKCLCNNGYAIYPGGEKKFNDTLHQMLLEKTTPQKEGYCYISVEINEKGILTNPIVVRSLDPAYEKVLLQYLAKAGKWIPACKQDYGIDVVSPDPDKPYPSQRIDVPTSIKMTLRFHIYK